MSRPVWLSAALAVVLLGVPGPASAQDARTSLEQATAQATALSAELERAAAQDGGFRVALERLEEEHDAARARLDARVRAVWTARRPDPLAGLSTRLAATGLRRITDAGASAAVRVDKALVDEVAARASAVAVLRRQALQARLRLGGQVEQALAAQESARVLLAEAERRLAEQVAAAADAARVAAETARLAAARAALDQASAVLTVALTPAQTRRSRRAQETEAPLVALVEAAGAGYPAGYVPSGQVLAGVASWYGPGFVGSPTASGSPYDPERLTCAHKTLRLGTVVRVSANGRAISCLVNDRGPYVGTRIIDLSRAGSRALGFDGVQQVVVEVLQPA